MATSPTHLLFDFFGTLVAYEAGTTRQDFSNSHRLLTDLGTNVCYSDFVELATRTYAELEHRCASSLTEYTMHDAAEIILMRVLDRPGTPSEQDAFVAAYLADWNTGVDYPDGIAVLLDQLASRFTLAVVSNTHHTSLVPDHLAAMGIRDFFEAVVLSVEIGYRKPHPAIYQATLDRLSVGPDAGLFIGDSYAADYQGPRAAGIRALLIDPESTSPVQDHDRISSIFELIERL